MFYPGIHPKIAALRELREQVNINEVVIDEFIDKERAEEIKELKADNHYNHSTIDLRRKELCVTCNNPGEELHTCPFEEEIYGDTTTMCNCCYECESYCCAEI